MAPEILLSPLSRHRRPWPILISCLVYLSADSISARMRRPLTFHCAFASPLVQCGRNLEHKEHCQQTSQQKTSVFIQYLGALSTCSFWRSWKHILFIFKSALFKLKIKESLWLLCNNVLNIYTCSSIHRNGDSLFINNNTNIIVETNLSNFNFKGLTVFLNLRGFWGENGSNSIKFEL